jgi:N-formylglutamate amidohydrolase
MSLQTATAAQAESPPIDILRPARQTSPVVYASPHSGTDYHPEFVTESALDPLTLRRSEDSFVDELFAAAPRLGSPLLKALFPRAYCDPNREAFELDPAMFAEALPAYVNTRSARVAGGLGTIAKVVASGAEIYSRKLSFAEAKARIDTLYKPYHAALRNLLVETRDRFGFAVLIDCHSMPSIGGPMDQDQGHGRPDIVLGDRFGTSCASNLTAAVEAAYADLGYRVTRNYPYAGGFTTHHYGSPATGVHALQIEINRVVYMDENRIERGTGFNRLAADTTHVIEKIARHGLTD